MYFLRLYVLWEIKDDVKLFSLRSVLSPVLPDDLRREETPRVGLLVFVTHLGRGSRLPRPNRVTLITPPTALGTSRSFSSHLVTGWTLGVPHSP